MYGLLGESFCDRCRTFMCPADFGKLVGGLATACESGGLVVSISTYEATDPGSILGVAIFPWSRRNRPRGL